MTPSPDPLWSRAQASPPLAAALVLRFLLELALLAGAAIAAWRLTPGGWAWAAAVVAPLLVAVLWGLLLSPRARVPLAPGVKLVIETLLFVGVAVALAACGLAAAGVIGVVIWAADRLAIRMLSPRSAR